MKVLIVDDEAPARARLRRLLENYRDVEIVGEASNGLMALEEIQALQPDVVFLDIEMPELDGLAVAGCLRKGGPLVVFVTAYNEHALKAFEVAAVDYLVKPVVEERLNAAIERLKRLMREHRSQDLSPVLAQLTTGSAPLRLATRCGTKFIVIDPEKLSAVVARDHYSSLVYDGRELLSEESLDSWSEKLGDGRFLRVHRSGLVNLDFLKELQREGDRRYFAVLSDAPGTRVAISRERLSEVMDRFGIA